MAGLVPSGGSRAGSVPCLFRLLAASGGFWRLLAFLGCGRITPGYASLVMALPSLLHQLSFPLPLLKTLVIMSGPQRLPRIISPFPDPYRGHSAVRTHLHTCNDMTCHTCKVSFAVKGNVHRFQGVGYGYLWGS